MPQEHAYLSRHVEATSGSIISEATKVNDSQRRRYIFKWLINSIWTVNSN